jgi:hypothetical protein
MQVHIAIASSGAIRAGTYLLFRRRLRFPPSCTLPPYLRNFSSEPLRSITKRSGPTWNVAQLNGPSGSG